MPSRGRNNFIQGYNCQAAVDEKAQIIVATHVTQQPNDKQQMRPLLEKVKSNLSGRLPTVVSADSGYFGEDNFQHLTSHTIEGFISAGKQKRLAAELQKQPQSKNDFTIYRSLAGEPSVLRQTHSQYII